jgi:hypothetical protein
MSRGDRKMMGMDLGAKKRSLAIGEEAANFDENCIT